MQLPFPYNSWSAILVWSQHFPFYPVHLTWWWFFELKPQRKTIRVFHSISRTFMRSHKTQAFFSLFEAHVSKKYINVLHSYLLIGTGCFPVPATSSNHNNYVFVYYRILLICVFCSLKCATLCFQMLMCFHKLLLTLTLMSRRGMLPIIMLHDGDLGIALHLVPFWILTIWGSVHIEETVVGCRNQLRVKTSAT